MSASSRDPRLRDVAMGVLLVVGIGYFGLAYAGPEGGCIPGGADIGFTWNATVTAAAGADTVTVRNTGTSMEKYGRTAALLVRVRGDGAVTTHILVEDHAFSPDIGFPFPHNASRTVRDVDVAGRDLQRGDDVRVVHRSSRLEPYCIRDVGQETLARTTA